MSPGKQHVHNEPLLRKSLLCLQENEYFLVLNSKGIKSFKSTGIFSECYVFSNLPFCLCVKPSDFCMRKAELQVLMLLQLENLRNCQLSFVVVNNWSSTGKLQCWPCPAISSLHYYFCLEVPLLLPGCTQCHIYLHFLQDPNDRITCNLSLFTRVGFFICFISF